MNTKPHLELIVGTMFSGKSTELIKRLNRYEIAGLKVQLFKPKIDDRYSKEHVTSHDGLRREVTLVNNATEIISALNWLKDPYFQTYPSTIDVIGIDEIQFLDSGIVEFCNKRADEGRIVIATGLLKNFLDDYFPFSDEKKNMSHLLEKADHLTYLKALCTHQTEEGICGDEATRVQRFIDGKPAPEDSPIVLVGGTEAYAPRCREHFHFYDHFRD